MNRDQIDKRILHTLANDKSVLGDFGCWLYVNCQTLFTQLPPWHGIEDLIIGALIKVDMRFGDERYRRAMGSLKDTTLDNGWGVRTLVCTCDEGWISEAKPKLLDWARQTAPVNERDDATSRAYLTAVLNGEQDLSRFGCVNTDLPGNAAELELW